MTGFSEWKLLKGQQVADQSLTYMKYIGWSDVTVICDLCSSVALNLHISSPTLWCTLEQVLGMQQQQRLQAHFGSDTTSWPYCGLTVVGMCPTSTSVALLAHCVLTHFKAGKACCTPLNRFDFGDVAFHTVVWYCGCIFELWSLQCLVIQLKKFLLIRDVLSTLAATASMSTWRMSTSTSTFASSMSMSTRYGDGAGNTAEENSSVFSLIWMG